VREFGAKAVHGSNGVRINVIAVGAVMTPLYALNFGVPAERADE
jgi:hypothetical protein